MPIRHVIIAGSRSYVGGISGVERAVAASGFPIERLIHGAARGADSAAGEWAIQKGIPMSVHPAEWETHGRAAGPIRNQQMADIADALIAIWDGRSRGTADMIRRMNGKPIFVYWEPGFDKP